MPTRSTKAATIALAVTLALILGACGFNKLGVTRCQTDFWLQYPLGVQCVIVPDVSAQMVWTESTPKPLGCGGDKYCVRTRLKQVPDTPPEFHEALDNRLDDFIDQVRLVGWGNANDPDHRDCVGLYDEFPPRTGQDWTFHANPEDGRCYRRRPGRARGRPTRRPRCRKRHAPTLEEAFA